MILSDDEVEVLISRFDKDGDGEIDMFEFRDFIEEEINRLGADPLSASTTEFASFARKARSSRPATPQTTRAVEKEKKSQSSVSTTSISSPIPSLSKELSESMPTKNVVWLTQLFKAQADIENKLGRSYYSSH